MNPQNLIGRAVTGQGFGAVALQGMQNNQTAIRDAMLNARQATEIQESPLPLHMNELLAALDGLSKQVDDLERTLHHVLVPNYNGQGVAAPERVPESANSDLITGLIARKEQVALISLKLSVLSSRIQL